MIALTAYLKGRGHMSYRTLQAYFHDIVGIDISTGFLVKQIQKTSTAIKLPYVKEMFATIHQQDQLTEIGFRRLF